MKTKKELLLGQEKVNNLSIASSWFRTRKGLKSRPSPSHHTQRSQLPLPFTLLSGDCGNISSCHREAEVPDRGGMCAMHTNIEGAAGCPHLLPPRVLILRPWASMKPTVRMSKSPNQAHFHNFLQ